MTNEIISCYISDTSASILQNKLTPCLWEQMRGYSTYSNAMHSQTPAAAANWMAAIHHHLQAQHCSAQQGLAYRPTDTGGENVPGAGLYSADTAGNPSARKS